MHPRRKRGHFGCLWLHAAGFVPQVVRPPPCLYRSLPTGPKHRPGSPPCCQQQLPFIPLLPYNSLPAVPRSCPWIYSVLTPRQRQSTRYYWQRQMIRYYCLRSPAAAPGSTACSWPPPPPAACRCAPGCWRPAAPGTRGARGRRRGEGTTSCWAGCCSSTRASRAGGVIWGSNCQRRNACRVHWGEAAGAARTQPYAHASRSRAGGALFVGAHGPKGSWVLGPYLLHHQPAGRCNTGTEHPAKHWSLKSTAPTGIGPWW